LGSHCYKNPLQANALVRNIASLTSQLNWRDWQMVKNVPQKLQARS